MNKDGYCMLKSSYKYLFFACIILMVLIISCSVLDLVPPRINIIRPGDQGYVGWRFDVVGEVEEMNLDRIEFFVNDVKVGEYRENEFNYTIDFPEPENILRVKAYDKGGNWSEVTLQVYGFSAEEEY